MVLCLYSLNRGKLLLFVKFVMGVNFVFFCKRGCFFLFLLRGLGIYMLSTDIVLYTYTVSSVCLFSFVKLLYD